MLQLSFVRFNRGSYLFVEGKQDNGIFYIIQSGRVSCSSVNAVKGTLVDELGPGDFVGVVSCMSNHSQVESVIALTEVVCIAVRRNQYPELIAQNTPVAMKIIRVFAQRMRGLNEQLLRLSGKGNVLPSPDQIFNVAYFYDKAGKPDIATYAYYHYLKACPTGEHADAVKKRFIALKPKSAAVYLESNADMTRTYPKDTMIFSEFQSGADMFIIQDGQVKISKVVSGNEVTLALLKNGDMFGEMALLENKPRSASAIANEDCKLMVINRQNFNQMVASQPQLVFRLTKTFAERIWSMYRQLSNTQLADPLAKLIDMLALQIEKARITITDKTFYRTDLSPQDLATMCALTKDQQDRVLYKFSNESKFLHIEYPENKIVVTDCATLFKEAEFNRNELRRTRAHEE